MSKPVIGLIISNPPTFLTTLYPGPADSPTGNSVLEVFGEVNGGNLVGTDARAGINDNPLPDQAVDGLTHFAQHLYDLV